MWGQPPRLSAERSSAAVGAELLPRKSGTSCVPERDSKPAVPHKSARLGSEAEPRLQLYSPTSQRGARNPEVAILRHSPRRIDRANSRVDG